MSCCTNAQPMISNSVNVCINPSNTNCRSIRVDIPLQYCRRFTIYGRVINNCNGSSVPHAKLRLLKKNPYNGCYRCISTTSSDCRGMYFFNLCLNRCSPNTIYKVVASAPYNRARSNNGYDRNCNQVTPCYENDTTYNSQYGCYISNHENCSSENLYNQGAFSSCRENRGCGNDESFQNQCTGYRNIEEVQDSYTNYEYSYDQNSFSKSNHINFCEDGFCNSQSDMCNFWND